MRIAVISDPHFAGSAEKARHGAEERAIPSALLRAVAGAYRRFVWLADPTAHNHQLDRFIAAVGKPDLVIAVGDYSCDTAFVGVSDDAAFASARECLQRLRTAFGHRLLPVMGDHELGKMSIFGGVGGPRLRSWHRTTRELAIDPVWHHDLDSHRFVGISSTIAALPLFEHELLPEERDEWMAIRENHQEALHAALRGMGPRRRLILVCHDPSAFPFLAADLTFAQYFPRIDATLIGHLHSELVLRASAWLAGMPRIRWLGNTVRRLSGALQRARTWPPFRPILCPSTSGIQMRRDGGFLELTLADEPAGGPTGEGPRVRVTRHRLPW